MTLVELLIVLGILAILAAIALPSMSPVVLGYRLRGAAWQLAGDLRLARQQAVSMQRRFRVCLERCAISVPAGSYSLERDDGTPSSAQWVSQYGVPTRIPEGVALQTTATSTFRPNGAASGSTFTLTNLLGSYQVVVNSTGRVTVCRGTCP